MTTKPDKDDYVVALEIEDVSGEDAGNYKIVAENKSGSTSATINLKFGGEYKVVFRVLRSVNYIPNEYS